MWTEKGIGANRVGCIVAKVVVIRHYLPRPESASTRGEKIRMSYGFVNNADESLTCAICSKYSVHTTTIKFRNFNGR
jgi:hypothetical protein